MSITLHPPVVAPLTQLWGEHPEWYVRYGYATGHNGEDYGCKDAPVHPAAGGIVTKIGYEPDGFGHFIKLHHAGGYQTIYAHLARVDVSLGQRVELDDVIGQSGSSGNSTGPHLHFGLYVGGQAVNPRPYMAAVEPAPGPVAPNPEPCPDTEHTPPGAGERGEVVVEQLFLRLAPTRTAQVVGNLQAPAVVDVLEVATEASRTWGRVTGDLWCCLREGCIIYVAARPRVGCLLGSIWDA